MIYQKIFEKKNFFLVFLFFFILYLTYFFNYNISKQHDVWLHHYYIFHILKLNFSNISSEYGIFYYLYTSCFSILTYPLYFFKIFEDRDIFYLTIRLSNLSLLIITLLIIFKISKEIFNFKDKQITLVFLLCFSFAFFNKTFFMARPENLMIPLSLIIILETYRIIERDKPNYRIILPLLCILSAQKISGLIFSLVILSLLFIKKKNKDFYKFLLLFICGLISLYLIHYLITGVKFYENSDRLFGNSNLLGIINNFDKFDIIYTFSIFDAWQNPLRDYHNYSIINILSLEFIGDYWRYGIFNNSLFKVNETCLIILNRTSIISFYIFLIFVLSSMVNFFYLENKFTKSKNLIIFLGFFLVITGLSVILLAVFFRANLTDLDIVKFEYISYFLLPLVFNLVKFSETNNTCKIIIFFLISLGLYNNLLPLHCII